MWKKFVCVITCMMCMTSSVSACTLFAANGDKWVKGGGTLIVKNRDWKPENQEMRLVENDTYRYYGIFTGNTDKMSLRGGINEKGLAVFSASASSVPKQQRQMAEHAKQSILKVALGECTNVDEALTHTELFLGPKFILLADANKIAYIEIAPNGTYKIKEQTNGTLAHTNHYLEPDLQWANVKIGNSSRIRYTRIEELLTSGHKPYTLQDFIAFSQDQHDGPDCSIWRIGSTPQKTQTLAALAVYIPKNKGPRLYIKIRTAPDEQGKEKIYTMSADQLFPKKNL